MEGVQVSTSDAINGQVDSVPVDSATAVATVTYASLNAAATENLADTKSKVEFSQGSNDALKVTGEYRTSGFNAQLDLQAKVVAEDGDLVVQLPADTLDGLPSAIRGQVKSMVAQASRLPSCPTASRPGR